MLYKEPQQETKTGSSTSPQEESLPVPTQPASSRWVLLQPLCHVPDDKFAPESSLSSIPFKHGKWVVKAASLTKDREQEDVEGQKGKMLMIKD